MRSVARNALGAVALLALAVLALAVTAAGANAEVRTAQTAHGKAEQIELLPISKQAWQDPRSIMSLPPEKVGQLIAGDRIEAAGEAEITTCLKPDPDHPGTGQPCIGDIYGYNPTIKAKLVVAEDATAAAEGRTKAISKTETLQCRQDHPVRNHHCVVSIPFSGIRVADPASLPCDNGNCHVSMLVSVYHPDAKEGEKVVVGSSDDNKRINQGLAQLSTIRYRPGNKTKPQKTWRGGRATQKMSIGSRNGGIKRQVIYSAKVSKLKKGDQLVVDAKARVGIKNLPYNVFIRTEVVFAKRKGSTKAYGKPLDTTARVSASNGRNCTQKKSAHSDVCEFRKTGVISVRKNAKGPFYVNIVAGGSAMGTAPQYNKWRSGDKAKIPKSGGYVKVMRYSGSNTCKTCSTGRNSFGPNNKPGGKPGQLVKQLNQFGINSGSYECAGQSDGDYVCKWRAEGKFGDGPKYKCESRADFNKKTGRFNIKVCKEQLASQLWHFLINRPDKVKPTFTGVCEETPGGDYKCKWFGDKATGPNADKGCKGFGVYRLPEHTWNIDPCNT